MTGGSSRKHKRLRNQNKTPPPPPKKKHKKHKYGQLSTRPNKTFTCEHVTHICTHMHTLTVRQMPRGQIQTSALFGIFMASLSLGKSEDLPGV